VPAREQFELWREFGARHLLSVSWERDVPASTPFRGAMTVRQLGETRFVDLRCDGHRAVPGAAPAARAAGDVCIVEQEITGPARYLIGTRQLVCRPGDLLVHSPDAHFEEDGPGDWATRIWVIPRRRLLPLLPAGVGPSLHIPRRDGVAALAAAAAEALAGQADRLEPAAADAAVDGFCRLLAVAAGVTAGAIEGGREALGAACLERARRHVDRHLTDCGLGPAATARAVGVSERQLQRLFEATGESFARHLLRRRLEAVRAALVGPGARPVTDLALAWGFGSLTAFYRGFHRAYGAAPGEVRAAAAGAGAA
jgi:AraC-like DNA-binding protein